MTMLQQLALKWEERRQALGLKGRKGEDAVYEYFIGAAVALELAGHPAHRDIAASTTALLAYAPFKMGLVGQWAAGMPEPFLAPEPGL